MDVFKGHVSGTHCSVKAVHTNRLILKTETGDNVRNIFPLPKETCDPGDIKLYIQGLTRMQFPVRVCFTTTIDKVQELSFCGAVVPDVNDKVFSHSQLYDELSIAISPDKLKKCSPPYLNSQRKNVVYLEALA